MSTARASVDVFKGAVWGTKVAYRYTTGAPLNGVPRTDAGWLSPGRCPLDGTGKASRWSLLPRLHRAGIRLAGTGAAGGLTAAYATDPTLTTGAVQGSALASAMWAGHRAGEAWKKHVHMREWVNPLHAALAPKIGTDGWVPRTYLHVPLDYADRTDPCIRIDLPPEFTGTSEERSALAHTVATKLGLSEVRFSYKLTGRHPHAMVQEIIRPRASVRFTDEDVLELVKAAAESAPLLGLGLRDAPVSVDFDTESPHILIAAPPGGGKSVLACAAICQVLHHGGQAVILDYKEESQEWAHDLPNVHYAIEIEDMHNTLIGVGDIIKERKSGGRTARAEGLEYDPPRLLIVVEEINATQGKLRRYWEKNRKQLAGKDAPKKSPAVEVLEDLPFMGRALKMNEMILSQSGTARAVGGPEVREAMTTRALGGAYTANAWKMLLPHLPMPAPTKHRGRMQIALGSELRETQVVYFTPDQAREWALSGTVNALDLSRVPGDVSRPGLSLVKIDGDGGQGTDEPELLTLREACKNGVIPKDYEAAKKERQRQKNTPRALLSDGRKGNADAYREETLRAWYERNYGSGKNEGEEAS